MMFIYYVNVNTYIRIYRTGKSSMYDVCIHICRLPLHVSILFSSYTCIHTYIHNFCFMIFQHAILPRSLQLTTRNPFFVHVILNNTNGNINYIIYLYEAVQAVGTSISARYFRVCEKINTVMGLLFGQKMPYEYTSKLIRIKVVQNSKIVDCYIENSLLF